ncbi:MAG: DMT family transporter [Muribaculaceae bacterium]|nr:DMT family transporter [Muribaculaceae bacterium]
MNKSDYAKRNAHIAILLANLGWGIMSPISKDVMLSEVISPLALSGIRITGGALMFFIFSFILPESVKTRQKIDSRDWLRLAAASLLIISANQGLFIIGVGMTNPIDSSVMSSLTPVFTMILAAIFLHFRMRWLKVSGVIIGLAGALLLVASSPQSSIASNPLMGDLFCMAAQFCAAVYYVAFSDIIRKYSPYTLMKWLFFISTFTYVPFCIPSILKTDFSAIDLKIWGELAYIIIVATFIGYLLIPVAQRQLKPTVVSMYNYLQPVFAAIIAVTLGVGNFGWVKAGATLMVFFGIALVNRSVDNTTSDVK